GPHHRVGVVAPNGTGKSTLLRILAGLDAADSGCVTLTPLTATVGYLPQEPDRREGETVRAYLARRTGVADAVEKLHTASTALAGFGVFWLDEPTNDLDFTGLERLERCLHEELAGGAVVVSHDRAFLDRTITSVLELDEHAHSATEYAGGWQSYLDEHATARRHAEEEYAAYRS